MHDKATLDWFAKNNLTPPSHQPHIKDDEIQSNLRRLTPHTWRMEGNELIGEVADGTRFVQRIPTEYILDGQQGGLPVFRKVVL